MQAATFFDGIGWREGIVEDVGGRVRLREEAPSVGLPRLDGIITGGFTDHHVHLQLVDHARLVGSRLGRVVDLGGNPATVRELAVHNSSERSPGSRSEGTFRGSPPIHEELCTPETGGPIRIDFAGAFLTTPDGYPANRSWTPLGSVREIADENAAAAAVAEMAVAGATCIKVSSNSTAGPVFSRELFCTIVGLAADRGLPVVAHAEGTTEAQRVVRLGAARLAHAPFTERLDDGDIARQAASASWISTLGIHQGPMRRIAIDNVRRFHAAGGTVIYGTDMGNGPTPIDLNPGEISALREAGLDDVSLLRALAPVDPLDPSSVLLINPGSTPAAADPLNARPLTPADLKV